MRTQVVVVAVQVRLALQAMYQAVLVVLELHQVLLELLSLMLAAVVEIVGLAAQVVVEQGVARQ
jgi:hypothetical protein